MVILIDTNIIIDFLMKRQPYLEDAVKIVSLCTEKKVKGYLAAHTVSNLFYILRKEYSALQRREMLCALCKIFEISEIDKKKILAALENRNVTDFEDCLQMECALEVSAEYIVTRNLDDYADSKITAIDPKGFLKLVENQSGER